LRGKFAPLDPSHFGTGACADMGHPVPQTAPRVLLLGTRGIPAAHGGFESFAEKLALFLVARSWKVTVYCQHDTGRVDERFTIDTWRGVERVNVQVANSGALGTMEFDWYSLRHAAKRDGVCLVLGYNTAAFLLLLRLAHKKILINMDGIEWKRPKWSPLARGWFYINEWLGAWLGHRLVADHPAIESHLATRRPRSAITMIPYGGDEVTTAEISPVTSLGLVPGKYLLLVARLEPDNNVLTFVQAFSRRQRNAKLVVLGCLDNDNLYHRSLRAAASEEVVFPGAIYDKTIVQALRFHARAYCHGHMVGGTNPSLVESLWCGNPVLAHRNRFNQWTAGAEQFFFSDVDECERAIDRVLTDDIAVARSSRAARLRAAQDFNWVDILASYEAELAALSGRTPALPATPTMLDAAQQR